MKKNKAILVITILMLFQFCNSKKQVEYFDDGVIKSEYFTKDGVVHGLKTDYYPNGQVKCRTQFEFGEISGIRAGYFENGTLEYKETWLLGKRRGRCDLYYENGVLEYSALFHDDVLIDTSRFYTKEGVLDELKVYGEAGSIAYLLKMDEYGDTTINSVIPLRISKPDTVAVGESISFRVSFHFDYFKNSIIEIGDYREDTGVFTSDSVYYFRAHSGDKLFTYVVTGNYLNLYLNYIDLDKDANNITFDGVKSKIDVVIN